VVPLNDQVREDFDIDKDAKGLCAVQIVDGSPANIIGLKPGDLIISVNGEKVGDIAAFYKVLREKTDKELWFDINRSGSTVESLKFKR